jgi:hypothetical protein
MMPDSRTNSENESSEDGSSSLEPQPAHPPIDEKMGRVKNVCHHEGQNDHRYSSFADAVANGHARAEPSTSADQHNCAGIFHHDVETTSQQHDLHLPPRAPQHYQETTQPLSSGKTSQMSVMSISYDTDSRANTPSGIMREMSLKDHESRSDSHNTGGDIGTDIECVAESHETKSLIDPTLKHPPTRTSETNDKTTVMTETSTDQADTSGVGIMLSEYNAHQPQQQPGAEHITTYYSMASQCSLPIHTPTAVAPDNERMRKLSKEFLRSPESTFERLSYILGRGRLVMVRN